jgi:hypothetical protein
MGKRKEIGVESCKTIFVSVHTSSMRMHAGIPLTWGMTVSNCFLFLYALMDKKRRSFLT